MTVSSILKQKRQVVFKVNPEDLLNDCLGILTREQIGVLLVTDRENNLLGLISERDIVRYVYSKGPQILQLEVKDVMVPAGRLITANKNDSIEDLMERMSSNRVRHLPVLENGQVLGIVSIGDVVKALLDLAVHENRDLTNYVLGQEMGL